MDDATQSLSVPHEKPLAPGAAARLNAWCKAAHRRPMRARVTEAIVAHLTAHDASLQNLFLRMHEALSKYARTSGSTPARVASARRSMLSDYFRDLLPSIERALGIRYYAADSDLCDIFLGTTHEAYISYAALSAAEGALFAFELPLEYIHREDAFFRDAINAAWVVHFRKLDALAHLIADKIAQSCECVEEGDDAHASTSRGAAEEEEHSDSDGDSGDGDSGDGDSGDGDSGDGDSSDGDSSDAESVNDCAAMGVEEARREVGRVDAAMQLSCARFCALQEEVAALATESEDMREALAELRGLEAAAAKEAQQRRRRRRQWTPYAREGKRRAIEALFSDASGLAAAV